MRELVFFLEERSAQAMLEGLTPRLGADLPAVRYVVFEGKSDLERNVTKRMRRYVNPEAQFIVIRDQTRHPIADSSRHGSVRCVPLPVEARL